MATTSQIEYEQAVNAVISNYANDMLAWSEQVIDMLDTAHARLVVRFQNMPKTTWTNYHYETIERQLSEIIGRYTREYSDLMNKALIDSAEAGISSVTTPLTAITGITSEVFVPIATDFFTRQAMNIVTSRISGAAGIVEKEIMSEIIIGMSSGDNAAVVVEKISGIIQGKLNGNAVGFKNLNQRSWTIFRTETMKIHNISTELQMRRSTQHIPGAKKEWIHNALGSGRGGYTPRDSHLALDGSIKDMDDAWIDGATGDALRFPHDPQAKDPASVINCTCLHALKVPKEMFEERTAVAV